MVLAVNVNYIWHLGGILFLCRRTALVFLLKGFTSSSEYTFDLWAVVESLDGSSEGGGTDIRGTSTGQIHTINMLQRAPNLQTHIAAFELPPYPSLPKIRMYCGWILEHILS